MFPEEKICWRAFVSLSWKVLNNSWCCCKRQNHHWEASQRCKPPQRNLEFLWLAHGSWVAFKSFQHSSYLTDQPACSKRKAFYDTLLKCKLLKRIFLVWRVGSDCVQFAGDAPELFGLSAERSPKVLGAPAAPATCVESSNTGGDETKNPNESRIQKVSKGGRCSLSHIAIMPCLESDGGPSWHKRAF